MVDFTDRGQLINYLRFHGIRLDTSAGQHFLLDASVIDKIIAAANLSKDESVLEIGPGVGTLTQALAAAVPSGLVLGIERDGRLVRVLRSYFADHKQVKVIHSDILAFNPREMHGDYQVVANLPYQITGAILRQFLTFGAEAQPPRRLVLMMQREVANRLLAVPGTRDRGVLTILRELFGPASRVVDVPAGAFLPAPEVESTVVAIDRDATMQADPDQAHLVLSVARAGFSAKRRTLANALVGSWHLPKGEIEQLLAKLEIPALARAEELTLPQWQALTSAWQAIREKQISEKLV